MPSKEVIANSLDLSRKDGVVTCSEVARISFYGPTKSGQYAHQKVKLKADVAIGDPNKSSGEVFVWLSNGWKSVFRLAYYDLHVSEDILDPGSTISEDDFTQDIDDLFRIGLAVVNHD